MSRSLIRSFQCEWLKTRRSLASWLVLGLAGFTPAILLAIRIAHLDKLAVSYTSADFWEKLWTQSWEAMAAFFLPMGIILVTALITQLEYKNNAWKQLHTTPQKFITIFSAKMTVAVVMLLQLFLLFNLGVYLTGVIPALLSARVDYPTEPLPVGLFLREDLKFFIDCLPMLALQFLLGLQFKNFLVPVGVGFLVWILGIGFISWEYSYILPYAYTTLDHFMSSGQIALRRPPISLQSLALAYFIVITVASYVLYVTKKVKG
jgi:hypothetical protein